MHYKNINYPGVSLTASSGLVVTGFAVFFLENDFNLRSCLS